MPKPLYVEDLPACCEHEGCGCGGRLYIHSKCHSGAPTWTFVEGGVLTVECSVCRRTIVQLMLEHLPKEEKN